MRALIVVFSLAGLGSCGQAARPFEHRADLKSDLLVLKDRAGIVVAPLAGDVPADPERLASANPSRSATFSPIWMDWPMLYRGNPIEIVPGMVIFVHIIIFDSDRGLAMTLGRTSLIGRGGGEVLSRMPLEFALT